MSKQNLHHQLRKELRAIHQINHQALKALEAQIIAKAWKDEAFRRELLSNPKAVAARELGITIPEGINIQVHEETPTTLHFILPMNPLSQRGELSESELEATGGSRFPFPSLDREWGTFCQSCDG